MKTKVRVKVSLTPELKQALEAVAEYVGLPLSQLLVESAVDRWLVKRAGLPQDLAMLCDRLRDLENLLRRLELDKPREPKANPVVSIKAKRSILDPVKPVLPGLALSALSTPEEALEDGKPLHIDNLVIRFGGDGALKARLSQLGGRDGQLFQGSLSHARRVEEVTARLDPDSLPWMPVDSDRLYWKRMNAEEFCKAVLTKS